MKKSVILVVVMGVMLIVVSLSLVALHIMSQQGRITEHKIRRTRAFSAARAGRVDAFAKLITGVINLSAITVGSPHSYSIAGFGSGIVGYPSGGYTITVKVVKEGDAANGCPAGSPSDYCVTTYVNYDL